MDKFGELPGYVDHILGYSISQEGMYFKDKSGGILFTKVLISGSHSSVVRKFLD